MAIHEILLGSVDGYDVLLEDKNPNDNIYEPEKDKIISRCNATLFINDNSAEALAQLGIHSIRPGISVSTLQNIAEKLGEWRQQALSKAFGRNYSQNVDDFDETLHQFDQTAAQSGVAIETSFKKNLLTRRAEVILDWLEHHLDNSSIEIEDMRYFKEAEKQDQEGENKLKDRLSQLAQRMAEPLLHFIQGPAPMFLKEGCLQDLVYLQNKYANNRTPEKLAEAKDILMEAYYKNAEGNLTNMIRGWNEYGFDPRDFRLAIPARINEARNFAEKYNLLFDEKRLSKLQEIYNQLVMDAERGIIKTDYEISP